MVAGGATGIAPNGARFSARPSIRASMIRLRRFISCRLAPSMTCEVYRHSEASSSTRTGTTCDGVILCSTHDRAPPPPLPSHRTIAHGRAGQVAAYAYSSDAALDAADPTRLRARLGRARMAAFDEETTEEIPMTDFHALEMQSIDGEKVKFDAYKGKVCLIVNLASR